MRVHLLYNREFELANSFVIRKYKEGDEKGIVELMRLCFGRADFDYWMRHWVWEYKENPLGNDIWVVEYNGQIVAHHSHIPANLKVGKKIFRSCIGADSMTHLNFRRRRLQRKIEDIAHSELVKAGIYFSYYFPGDIFHKHKKRGANYDVCKIPVMMKFFDTNETLRKLVGDKFLAKGLSVFLNPTINVFFRSKKNPIVKDLKITEIARFDDRINDFWKNVSRYFDIIVVRNKEYLNWRYFQRPNSSFKVLLAEEDDKILGYIVFSPKDKKGFIVDLLVYPHRLGVIQRLVLTAVEKLREEKVYQIICWMFKNSSYYKVLRTNGFIPLSSKHPFGVTIYSPSNVPIEFVKDPKHWFLTLGDTDGMFPLEIE